jgi:recombinational DNA repair protein (RecF pathway)
MAYQTYITEALVCGSRDSNTADRSFLVFTRDAGMVYVHAKSIREERSKHRYALQDFSHVRITLVRGKSGWKVIGTEPIQNFYAQAGVREERAFLKNVVSLLRRVMQGETPHESIFDDVLKAFKELSSFELRKLETALSFRILHVLGYVAPSDEHVAFLGGVLTPELVEHVSEKDEAVYRDMALKALQESHL